MDFLEEISKDELIAIIVKQSDKILKFIKNEEFYLKKLREIRKFQESLEKL